MALNLGAVQEEGYYFLGTVLYRFIYMHQYNETNVMSFSFNLLSSAVCEAPPEDDQVMLETC
jgi:hypothetical protein